MVTELVNNAVAHGPGRPITLALVIGDETIRGEVADQGNPSAAIPDIKEASQRGSHGLKVVEKLTSRWAVYEGSTHVWFELPLDVARARAQARVKRRPVVGESSSSSTVCFTLTGFR